MKLLLRHQIYLLLNGNCYIFTKNLVTSIFIAYKNLFGIVFLVLASNSLATVTHLFVKLASMASNIVAP
jgi:hypothetical protein